MLCEVTLFKHSNHHYQQVVEQNIVGTQYTRV